MVKFWTLKATVVGPAGSAAFCAGLTIATVGTVEGGGELSSLEPHADSPKQRSRDATIPVARRIFQIVIAMVCSV
jgi:hypothetical protein